MTIEQDIDRKIYEILEMLKSGEPYQNRIVAIENVVPEEATSTNKLTDKEYVDNSISTSSATFLGTSTPGLTEQQFLAWLDTLTADNNDYVYWDTVDADNVPIYKRYKYTGEEWLYEYSFYNVDMNYETNSDPTNLLS